MWFKSNDDIDSLIARERYGKAIRLLNKQLKEQPDNLRLRRRLGDVLGRASRYSEAIEVLKPLVEQYAEQGFSNKAIAVVKKIQRLDPDYAEADTLISRVRAHSVQSRFEAPPLIHPDLESDTSMFESPKAQTDYPAKTSEVSSNWFDFAAVREDFRWSSLLSHLSGTDLVSAVGQLDLLVKNPGAVICGQGEAAESVFILAAGFARAYRRDPDNRYKQSMVIHEGQFFGEESVYAPEDGRYHTVTAGSECELLEIDLDTLSHIIGSNRKAADHLEQVYRGRPWAPRK